MIITSIHQIDPVIREYLPPNIGNEYTWHLNDSFQCAAAAFVNRVNRANERSLDRLWISHFDIIMLFESWKMNNHDADVWVR